MGALSPRRAAFPSQAVCGLLAVKRCVAVRGDKYLDKEKTAVSRIALKVPLGHGNAITEGSMPEGMAARCGKLPGRVATGLRWQ